LIQLIRAEAKSVGRIDFKREEWNLEHESDKELNTILTAKAR